MEGEHCRLGTIGAQTLRCHELGGLKEPKEDQCGWKEVCRVDRGNELGKRISWGLTVDKVMSPLSFVALLFSS